MTERHLPMVHASDVSDDGLVISSDGATVLLRGQHRPNNSVFLKVDTDSCGMLQRMEDRRSIFVQSASPKGFQDEDPDFDDMAPPDKAWALVGNLLMAHPEVAVMSEAIDKSCWDYNWLDDGDEDPSVIA